MTAISVWHMSAENGRNCASFVTPFYEKPHRN